MIEFTIKTLDSNNHNFSVEDEITIQQLKEKVREQMGIDINLQRLIFCGRVLQDEKRLSDYDVHGKVVHLVQRAPPSPESRHSTYSANTSGGTEGNAAHQTRRPSQLANIIREDQASASPTSGRLDFIRLMVSEIKTSLASLQPQASSTPSGSETAAPGSSEANVESMETDATPNAAPEEGEPTLDETGEVGSDSAARAQQARRRSHPRQSRPRDLGQLTEEMEAMQQQLLVSVARSDRAVRALRTRHSRPRVLGQLMEELEALQQQFAPHRAQYTRLLWAANNAEPPVYTEEERQSAQRTVDIVSDIMHSFAHAYHAISDINFQVGQRNPRLTSEASVMRHPLPMQQAHINVVQSNRRPPGQNGTVPTAPGTATATAQAPATTATATSATSITSATVSSGTATTTTSASTTPSATATTNPEAPAGTDSQNAPGRNSTQPTVNINIQPDPITYQVEIETRVPIAFALENALLNGLTTAHGQVPTANAANAPAAAQDGQNNQQTQPNQQGLPNQPSQPNQPTQPNQPNQPQARRQVLFDFENLFLGLGQNGGLGGVEVVMSMEEIPNGGIVGQVHPGQTGPAGHQAPPTLQGLGNVQTEGGGNTPHIFGADIYLGGMPWGGAPSADLLQNIVSSVIRQGLLPGGEAVALQVAPAVPAQDQPQQQNGHTAGRHANLHLRRATTTTRAHAVTLNNFIYDRFLLCVSPHARRRLLARREEQQNRAAATARAFADRAASQNIGTLRSGGLVDRAAVQNIEVLRERNPNFTQNHIQTMVNLLSSDPTPASFTNAFLVAVARHLFLTEPMQIVSGEPALVPNEFQPLRQMLRVYLQGLLVRSGGVHSEHTFETAAGFLVDQQRDFLARVESIVPLRQEFNFGASLRALIASRLPALVAFVMSESATEAFVARFYAMFSHLFTDMCTLMAYCCRDGVDGLRTLFRAFLEEKVRDFGSEDIQQVIITLGMENLGIVINSLNAITQVDPIQQFVIRRAPVPAAVPQEPSPMDVSPPASEAPAPTAPAAPAAATPAPVAPTTPTKSPIAASDVSSTTTDAGDPSASRPLANNEASPTGEPQASRSTPSQSARPSRTERETAPQRTSPDSQSNNLNFVPPMMLLQHWGEEWVPVFTRDQHNMGAQQEPYSDAYLSGMPSRKRRCVRQSRPPHTLESFINESVREASERPAPVDSEAVRRAFREHMRTMARSRASSSEDYDPLRYASAARFLNSPDAKKEPAKKSEDKA